ncbi:type II secretion system protein GspL [Halomonas elongata]|uniref:type II secretion system protein GspL n=1 Tax=Halomonas elongata TaxID=2746 RepID=UPI0040347C5C
MSAALRRMTDALGEWRERWRTRWCHSLARHWWRVWLAELAGMLPAAVARRLSRRESVQRLAWPLPEAFDRTRPAVLVLDADQVMRQRLMLPREATRHLARVLRYELDRYLPYAPDEVHFVARIVERSAAGAEVELVALAKDRLEAMLAQCRARGVRLCALDATNRDGERLGLDLLPPGTRAGRGHSARLERWLWAGVMALALGQVGVHLHQCHAALEAMRATVDAQRDEVSRVQRLRRSLADTAGASRYLAERKASRPMLSGLLAELTACLGDDSWLERLEVEDIDRVSVSGQSARAGGLVQRLEGCSSLTRVRFQGVIQTDDATGQERFSIGARLVASETADPSTGGGRDDASPD